MPFRYHPNVSLFQYACRFSLIHFITMEKSICSFHRIFFKNAFHQIFQVFICQLSYHNAILPAMPKSRVAVAMPNAWNTRLIVGKVNNTCTFLQLWNLSTLHTYTLTKLLLCEVLCQSCLAYGFAYNIGVHIKICFWVHFWEHQLVRSLHIILCLLFQKDRSSLPHYSPIRYAYSASPHK